MKETTSLTLRESAVFLAGNAYLRDVAVLVIAYGTSINIVEGSCTREQRSGTVITKGEKVPLCPTIHRQKSLKKVIPSRSGPVFG